MLPRKWTQRAPSVSMIVKAMEGVKNLDLQPRRTLRRRGIGMLGQPSAQQGRSHVVAVQLPRKDRYKRVNVKSEPALREKSEGAIVLLTLRTT